MKKEKLLRPKTVWVGLCVLGLVLTLGACTKKEEAQDQTSGSDTTVENCAKTGSQTSMSYDEAKKIASEGECAKEGTLKSTHQCNENSGTWWIDLEATQAKEGCNPACVVDAESKSSEINWRCTGLLSE
ncbi:hypothetical protein KKC60_04425 [Patescibacteria group bacterium]|nr:hypothetical protein [Patescibacteria group bacterium]